MENMAPGDGLPLDLLGILYDAGVPLLPFGVDAAVHEVSLGCQGRFLGHEDYCLLLFLCSGFLGWVINRGWVGGLIILSGDCWGLSIG